MSDLTLVPTVPEADYPAIAAMIGVAYHRSSSPERLYHRDTQILADDIFEQYTARTGDRITGYGSVFWSATANAPKASITVIVDAAERNRGYGTQIYAHVQDRARHHGAKTLITSCMEATPEALAFAEKHGFRIQHHSFESVLDVAAFDIARYADSVRAAEAAGIRFSSLVVEGNTDANLEKLFVLNTRVADDEPTSDGTAKHTFESWKARIAGSDWFYAPGQLLAIDGDQYIGLGAVGFEPDGQAFNAFTGVLPGYRGRKIAQALKLKGVEFARACGAKTIRTSNDSQNAPMLAINTKFGYQREPGLYRLIKDV